MSVGRHSSRAVGFNWPVNEEARLAEVRRAVAAAATGAGRPPGSVRLLAVSKTRSAAEVRAARAAGQREFGENYVQEALAKMPAVGKDVVWHFIGAVQANKTRAIARHFQWVHTVDRLRVADRLEAAAEAPLDICVQVNVDAEPQKAGVAPERVRDLIERLAGRPGLRLRGLMALPDPAADPRAGFRRLRRLFEDNASCAGEHWDTLSMGMSGDFQAAIAEGATIVRIGTAIFGPRAGTPAAAGEQRP